MVIRTLGSFLSKIDNGRNLQNLDRATFVSQANAALNYGDVGTYAMLAHSNWFGSLGTKPEGTIVSGSILRAAGIALWTTPPADSGALLLSYAFYRFVTCGPEGVGLSGQWMIVSREVRHGQGVNIWLRVT